MYVFSSFTFLFKIFLSFLTYLHLDSFFLTFFCSFYMFYFCPLFLFFLLFVIFYIFLFFCDLLGRKINLPNSKTLVDVATECDARYF